MYSPDFLDSPANNFYMDYAQAVGIGECTLLVMSFEDKLSLKYSILCLLRFVLKALKGV